MVLKKQIRLITGIIAFLALMLCFSCEDVEPLIINCNECYTDEPDQADIEIKLEELINPEPTIIKIYEGNLEENLLTKTIATNSESINTKVALNKLYTMTATYYIDGSYYTAVNSLTPRIKYEEEQCEEPCYYAYDRIVNLKLKYTK
ncbi:MAG: hypothetical protein MUC93_04630 [Bacteroidales bacterium]|jgi:hypothetical protein|nr:hypothetical protein [Bacteroidales bacterium]